MPIYAYRCGACGHTKDVLQKLADPALTQCPACHAPAFGKQLTAPGFQLKGTGWYATDFKGSSSASGAQAPAQPAAAASDAAPAAGTAAPAAAATEA